MSNAFIESDKMCAEKKTSDVNMNRCNDEERKTKSKTELETVKNMRYG